MSANRKVVLSESDFESAVGYSRAVRVGPHVAVAGTTGTGPVGDIAAQARDALRRIEVALRQADAELTDVVRTRIYVTDMSRWREVAAVHAQIFGDIRPVTSITARTGSGPYRCGNSMDSGSVSTPGSQRTGDSSSAGSMCNRTKSSRP